MYNRSYPSIPIHTYPSSSLITIQVLEPNGEYTYHHQFKLPEGLRGDLILLQWYYLTANSW